MIRSWESLGLTRPHRTASKYRLYAPEDVQLLKRARFLRKVHGLNAAAIVQMLKRDGLLRALRMARPTGSARGCASFGPADDWGWPRLPKRWGFQWGF